MEHNQLHKVRHSLAHLLAMAVLEHDPEAKLAIGPVIDEGFYYDFEFSEGKTPTDKDLKNFQKRIKKLASQNLDFVYREISSDDARKMFSTEPYKAELIEDLITDNKTLSTYTSGIFTDLCSGPHVANTSEIATDAFKIDRVAGAYWRGDEKNKMLTRIYGIAFETKEDLDNYIYTREEAKKRDHRKLGKELDLFTFSELVGGGLPLFTVRGTAMRNAIINKIKSIQEEYGYQEVTIPHITKPDLYKTSGHWEKFGDELFKVKGRESEFVMKPMNCPHHTQIFASQARTYKDLPQRFMETTMVYRDEQSGELLGLGRVRSISQDDGHAFCTPEQVEQEIDNIVSVIKEFYTALGMWNEGDFWVSLSTRDEETMLGNPDNWDIAEKALADIAEKRNLKYTIVPGEAAFYGPKLDFMFKDSLGRERQLATVQLDFVMPERFGLEYVDADGTKKTPVMIHRAIAGSLERFLSIIIEHFAGNFPTWLAPVQVDIIPVQEEHNQYAQDIQKALKKIGVRTNCNTSNDGFGKKVRNSKNFKTPYFIIVGDEDIQANSMTVEHRDNGKIGQMKLRIHCSYFKRTLDFLENKKHLKLMRCFLFL